MKRVIMKVFSVAALLVIGGCVALVFVGCQTRVTWERYPETALPVQSVVSVNGVEQLATTGYQLTGGGWYVTARSPLFAKEQFSGFALSIGTNGETTVALNSYDRDLSTNAVTMTKTFFDGSANLALAVAKAYATISTCGASDAGGALVSKVVKYFKAQGGDPSKSSVLADTSASKLTVTDGVTSICCDSLGNCSACKP